MTAAYLLTIFFIINHFLFVIFSRRGKWMVPCLCSCMAGNHWSVVCAGSVVVGGGGWSRVCTISYHYSFIIHAIISSCYSPLLLPWQQRGIAGVSYHPTIPSYYYSLVVEGNSRRQIVCHVIHNSCVYNHHLVLCSGLLLMPVAADLVWPAGWGRVRHVAVQARQRSTGLS